MAPTNTQKTDADSTVNTPEWQGEAPTNYEDIRELMALAFHSAGVDQGTVNEAITTVDDSVVNNEAQLDWTNNPEIQAELKRSGEGVGLSLYDMEGESPLVLDETWWTWGEFVGMEIEDLPHSAKGAVALRSTQDADENSHQNPPTREDPDGSVDVANNRIERRNTSFDNLSPDDAAAIKRKVDTIIDVLSANRSGADPLLVVAGDPPMYNDRLPYNGICTEYSTTLSDHRIVSYNPRGFKVAEDGGLVLYDGDMDGNKEGETEFQVEIPPNKIIGYWAF